MNRDRQMDATTLERTTGIWQSLLEELEHLLEKQIELVLAGSIADAEALSRQTGPLVEKIAQAAVLDWHGFRDRREHLKDLYARLSLALAAQRADSARKLTQVRKIKKTMAAYRDNV